MCELFGINSAEEYQINDYLMKFYSRSNGHPHGWGLACMENNLIQVEKEPVQATKSNYLKERLSDPIIVKNALGHIRYATIGHVEYGNCHPHTLKDKSGRRWVLIHNGTIFDYPPLSKYVDVQNGETDSERILLYVVDLVDQKEKELNRTMSGKERFQLIDAVIVDMSEGNKLNLMLYDGELLYVHTNYEKSLYELKRENQILFSTAPLSKESWEPVTFGTLLAYQDGKRIFTGTSHGHEYKDSEENMKFLYSIFSDL